MTLYFITANKNKLREVKEILGIDIKQLDINLPEIQELDSKKIIKEKIEEAIEHHKGKFIVEDTSLYFEGLNGLPGPLIKWFLSALGLEGLFNLCKASGDFKATASTMIGYYNGKEIQFVRGEIWIEIVPAGNKVTY